MTDSELLSIFWAEVGDYLQTLNNALLQVEMTYGQDRANILKEMNRVAHSMKGAARAVGIKTIETIAHYMEEVFQIALKDGKEIPPNAADILYDGLDIIQNIMEGEENSAEMVAEVLTHLERIVGAMSGAIAQDETTHDDDSVEIMALTPEEVRLSPSSLAIPSATLTLETAEINPTLLFKSIEETIRVPVYKLDRLMAESSELLVAKLQGEEHLQRILQLRRRQSRWLRDWRNVRAAYIRLVRRLQEQGEEEAAELAALFKFLEANERNLNETSRDLMQLGQLISVGNMNLSALADSLQGDIASMRMMPFETLISGFQRTIRDLSRELNKQVHLNVVGATVEIDKSVLDMLNEPLLHLLRNALDHGLETPAEREAKGKPPTGRITIHVEQRGNEIIVRVRDDGKGLDLDKIRARAVRNGIISEADVAELSDDEVRQLIFQQGFSTSDLVTAVSGRGVGMDIVRTRVESMRGQVSVQSVAGEGTTITLRLPVSLTRIRCILLEIGPEQYALPSAIVGRMETVQRADVFTAEGKEMVMVNGRPLPLVPLGAILDIPMTANTQSDLLQVMVLEAADRMVAFEVDHLSSELELVLKPLGAELRNAPFVAGAALMGNGDVIIVLDANDLVRYASGALLPQRRIAAPRLTPATTQRRVRVLVVDDSITTRTLEKNILETAGFDVHVAIDGVEAWEMLGEMEFDLVITDVEMPKMNGLELCQRIKSHHQMAMPVILLTSLSKPEQREAGLRAGADAYLVKSQFDQGQLLETIQAVL